MKDHPQYGEFRKNGVVKPNNVFDVILVTCPGTWSTYYCAELVYGDPAKRKIAYSSKQCDTMEGAMASLVKELGRVIYKGIRL